MKLSSNEGDADVVIEVDEVIESDGDEVGEKLLVKIYCEFDADDVNVKIDERDAESVVILDAEGNTVAETVSREVTVKVYWLVSEFTPLLLGVGSAVTDAVNDVLSQKDEDADSVIRPEKVAIDELLIDKVAASVIDELDVAVELDEVVPVLKTECVANVDAVTDNVAV